MPKHGAVAAGNRYTAEAAATVLRGGGNAFDAVLAGMVASCVAEPVFCSFGGGGFLLAHPKDGPRTVFDFFTQSPSRREAVELDFHEVFADFGTLQQGFHIGRAASAVPGLAAGLFHIHQKLGRAPIADILAPGISLAKDGLTLDPVHARVMNVVGPIMTATPEARALFCDPATGNLLGPHQTYNMPEFSDFLMALETEGPTLFYEGEVAQLILDLNRDAGLLCADDLAQYRVEERTPIEIRYRDTSIDLNTLPSAGGPLIAHGLSLLDKLGPMPKRSHPDYVRRLVSVMARTSLARHQTGFADAPTTENASQLCAEERLREDVQAIKTGGTTHISVADQDGNIASMSLSNGEGNGHIIPGTGIMMNNMLGEEDLNPGGFFRWKPNTRVQSMMTPCLAELPNGGQVALGSGGSNRIRSAILQVLTNLIDQGMPLNEAVDAPRLHLEKQHLGVEPGFPDESIAVLQEAYPDMSLWPEKDFFFGGVHGVLIDTNGTVAAAGDPRRGGCALTV